MNKLISFTILIASFWGMLGTVYGQTLNKVVEGKVVDEKGMPIPYATVFIKNPRLGTVTDGRGHYSFIINNDKPVELLVQCLGYTEYATVVPLSKKSKTVLDIQLKTSSTTLNDVLVVGKSELALLKEKPFAVTAINAQPLQVRNLDVNGILATTTGVKIREEGGLGSGFTFSLNGFSGNQIRFFIDYIPMDNFGSSLSLNNIPVNLIQSIEVYKGVVPIELGIDALGGAVNIVTNKNTQNFLDISYSLGSFNTHRASVVSRYTHPATGLRINANAFYNYSDNNYKIWAEVADPETGSIGEPIEVSRFHDGYHSMTGQLEIGVVDKKYADNLFLGVIASGNYKEVQTGYNMTKVAGQVHTTSKRFILSLKYAKKNLWIPGFHSRLYATYIQGEDLVADTSSRQYDWYGNYTVKEFGTSGELTWNKTLFRFNDHATMNTVNLAYEISPAQSVSFNNTFVYFRRKGSDPISYDAVPFSEPNEVNKNITGLSYNHKLWGGKFKSSVFTKLFVMNAHMYDDAETDSEEELEEVDNSSQNFGYGIAATYFINAGFQVKTSFESTYRLPETIEMFGDGLNQLPNPNLIPEQSKNFNLRFIYKKQVDNSWFATEATYLFRLPKNLIKQIAEGTQAWYENYTRAKINSVEADFKYSYKNKLRLNVNGTYQDVVDNNKTTSTGGENYLYGVRLANIPYLFGNASAGYQFSLWGHGDNKASVDWNTHFVESFYLKSPSQGYVESKYEIPGQLSHSLSVSFLFDQGRYNLSFACTNLTNNELYDNFKLQKPGRAYSVKFRYFVAKQ